MSKAIDVDSTLVDTFKKLGLSDQKAIETAKNKKLSLTLKQICDIATNEATGEDALKTTGSLLYTLGSTISPDAIPFVDYLTKAIVSEKLNTPDRVQAGIEFLAALEKDSPINDKEFDEACGVGISISEEEIQNHVNAFLSSEPHASKLSADRYRYLGIALGGLKNLPALRWADGGLIRSQLEKQVEERIGKKDERDVDVKKKGKKQNKEKNEKKEEKKEDTIPKAQVATDTLEFMFEGEMLKLHKPGGNKQIKASLMEKHLKETGGKLLTRFPPEPNGFLHIGHAKAININFGYAQHHNGLCNLRYDDTNPEAEEAVYFDSILETVEWLGFKPWKITYSSDNFQQLYEWAVELICRDKAYVCFCTAEEIQAGRGGPEKGPRSDCRHRNRPVEESLRDFERMKNGFYKEGEAILRMKMDMQNPNPQFWDLVAYRILYTPHHRTGRNWCIYPTYDYTHCLCDSIENITHSLCTREFTMSRESYYWLCDALEVYKPVQWEYGRLSLTNTVLSKRKLTQLVQEGLVEGWDDPRLYTLSALRRRGIPPQAINRFVRSLGVTTSNTNIEMERLDNVVRDYLNETAPRIMLVEDPIKVVLRNVPEKFHTYLTIPNKPRDPVMGEHKVPFTHIVYIDRSDYRDPDKGGDDPNFYRLSINKRVGLLYVPGAIKCTAVLKRDATTGEVLELEAEYEDVDGLFSEGAALFKTNFKKPKSYIHWIADSPNDQSPVPVTLYKYDKLFEHSNPMDKTLVPNGWLSDVRKEESLTVLPKAFCEVGILGWLNGTFASEVKDLCKKNGVTPEYVAASMKYTPKMEEELRFQFVRLGYYCLDKRSHVERLADGSINNQSLKLVFNRTVSLKEDVKKD